MFLHLPNCQLLCSPVLFSSQTFLLRSFLSFLKLFFRRSLRAGVLTVPSYLRMSFMSPSFLKDCLAKNRNISGKLFSPTLICLLLSLIAIEKFCQFNFLAMEWCVWSLLVFQIFSFSFICCWYTILCLSVASFYFSYLNYILFLSVDSSLLSVLKISLACFFQVLHALHSPSLLIFWNWLDFVDLVFPSFLPLVHFPISRCGVLHNFLNFLF